MLALVTAGTRHPVRSTIAAALRVTGLPPGRTRGINGNPNFAAIDEQFAHVPPAGGNRTCKSRERQGFMLIVLMISK